VSACDTLFNIFQMDAKFFRIGVSRRSSVVDCWKTWCDACMFVLSPKNDVESSEVFRPGFSPFLHPCRALDRECKAFKPPRVTQEQEEDAKPKKLEQVRGTAQTMVCCRLSSTTTMANNVCLCLGASALAIRESISWHRSHYISVAMSNWQHLTVVWKEV